MSVDLSPTDDVVVLRDVEKSFANGTTAIGSVDLTVSAGEFVSLLGPSGCGKSTVLRLVAGLEQPSSGSVSVFGTDPRSARTAGGIAYVFQDATLLPWLSVWKNVALPLTLDKRPRAEIATAVENALAVVGLSDRSADLPRQLSGGMRMRVSIARALTLNPRLLLMDEPFGALDEITRQALQREVHNIWRSVPGMSVLFVTHNVFEAAFLSTRVVVLGARPGRVIADIENAPAGLPTDAAQPSRHSAAYADRVSRISAVLESGSNLEVV